MRYEVLIMMAVVGAINVIGRIMAKRAKDRLAAEQAQVDASVAVPKRVVAPRPSVAQEPIPELLQAMLDQARRQRSEPPVAQPSLVPAPPAPASGAVSARAVTEAATRQGPAQFRIPALRRSRTGWSARLLRDGLVAAEILGPPVSLRG